MERKTVILWAAAVAARSLYSGMFYHPDIFTKDEIGGQHEAKCQAVAAHDAQYNEYTRLYPTDSAKETK